MRNTLFLLFILTSINILGQNFQPKRLAIVVSDMDASAKWYKDVLDMEVYKEMSFPDYDSLKITFVKNDSFEFELLSKSSSFSIKKYVPDYSVNNAPMHGPYKLAFKVNDLQGLFEKTKKLGVEIQYEITEDPTFNSTFFIVADPDGNTFQFIEEK